MKKRVYTVLGTFIIFAIFTLVGGGAFGNKYVENRLTVGLYISPILLFYLIGSYFFDKKSIKTRLKFRKNFERVSNNSEKLPPTSNTNSKDLKIELISEIGESTYYRMTEFANVLINQGDDIDKIKSELVKYGLSEPNANKLLEIIYEVG